MIQIVEFYFSPSSEVIPSHLKLEKVQFETYQGEKVDGRFSMVSFQKIKSGLIKLSARYFSSSDVELEAIPDDLKLLSNLIITSNGSPIGIVEVKNILVFGEDRSGYSVAKEVVVPKGASFLTEKDVNVRHLVVTGIHGNFKDKKKAKKRASLYPNSKVIHVMTS